MSDASHCLSVRPGLIPELSTLPSCLAPSPWRVCFPSEGRGGGGRVFLAQLAAILGNPTVGRRTVFLRPVVAAVAMTFAGRLPAIVWTDRYARPAAAA